MTNFRMKEISKESMNEILEQDRELRYEMGQLVCMHCFEDIYTTKMAETHMMETGHIVFVKE